jgi:SAF domain-containing protein
VTTVLTRSAGPRPTTANGLRLEPARPRRRPALAVGSLALVVACVAIFASVYLKAGNQTAVLVVARTVPAGQVVSVGDLTTVRLSTAAGLSTIAASEASATIGRRAAEQLDPGTLLTPSDLVASYAPPAGESIVGVALKEGQLPASGLVGGETVDVILTGPPGQPDSDTVTSGTSSDPAAATAAAAAAAASATPAAATGATTAGTSGSDASSGTAGIVLVPGAIVLEVLPSSASSGSDGVDVSLLTPSTLAPLLADASAADQVALVVVAPGS